MPFPTWPAPIRATVILTTDAPPEWVWRAFESAPRWPEVLQDVEAAEIAPAGRLVAGAVMHSRGVPGTMAVDMAYHVLAAERPHHLQTESIAAGFRARTDYRFETADGGGTTITLTADVAAERTMMRLYIAIQRKRHVELIEASLTRRMQSMLALAETLGRESGKTQPHDMELTR